MIIEEYDESLFISRFEDYGRVGEGKNFSYEGLRFLYEYLDELSEGMNEPMKLDVIGLCCDFTEYENLEEYLKDYSNQHDLKQEEETEEEFKERIEEEIQENTSLIKFGEDMDDGFIIQAY